MGNRIRKGLIFLLFGLLFLPMVQVALGLVIEKPLEGISKEFVKPQFSLANWSRGSFQDSLTDYLNQNCGFHNFLIRFNNQYYYSLFNTARANNVIIGQDNFLYDRQHIDAYTGADFLGYDSLRTRMLQIRRLQERLQRKNVRMLMVVVPGKATGAPEHLPTGTPAPGATNYQVTRKLADSLGIPFLDLIAWYRATEPTSPYPLYPPGGIHWSTYCSTLAADTLFGRISQLMQVPLPRFKVGRVRMENTPIGEDGDINRGMNLLFPLPSTPLGYPEINWNQESPKLRVLSVSDSYYFRPFVAYSHKVFAQSHQWFYFRELHKIGEELPTMTADVDISQELLQQDLVLLYVSDAHLRDFSWGFVEAALNYFEGPIPTKSIIKVAQEIKTDANWYRQIQEKAANEGVPTDTMLKRDAIWVLEMLRGNQ